MSVWRNLPLKAKIGAVLFGFFVLVAIIGPMVEPYEPGFVSLDPALSLNHPSACTTCSAPRRLGEDILSQVLTGTRLTFDPRPGGRASSPPSSRWSSGSARRSSAGYGTRCCP